MCPSINWQFPAQLKRYTDAILQKRGAFMANIFLLSVLITLLSFNNSYCLSYHFDPINPSSNDSIKLVLLEGFGSAPSYIADTSRFSIINDTINVDIFAISCGSCLSPYSYCLFMLTEDDIILNLGQLLPNKYYLNIREKYYKGLGVDSCNIDTVYNDSLLVRRVF